MSRNAWLTAGFVTLLVVGLLASLLRLNDARAAAFDSQTNLARMNSLVSRIEALRQNESLAMMQGEQKVEDSKTWIDCIRAVGIEERQIHTINRLPIRKIEKSDYSQDDVFIEVDDITSEQLVKLLLKCEDASMAYKVVSVHLTRAATGTATQDRWNLDLLLMRLLYSKANTTKGR